jgi:hypothetical protein
MQKRSGAEERPPAMKMTTDGTVVVARRELTSGLQDRLSFDPAVRVFSAAETKGALATVVAHGVAVVALDRRFATTPGGIEFTAELRAALPELEIRILSDEEGGEVPLVLRRPVLATGRAMVAAHSELLRGHVRRAPRYPVPPGSAALINGAPTALVNVSATGAQLVSPDVLRPAQQVRIALADRTDAIKLRAAVAWSAFERSRQTGATCYRVGLEFAETKRELLEAYYREYGIDIDDE